MRRRYLNSVCLILFLGFSGAVLSAKEVTLEWDSLEGAIQYELAIEKSGKPILTTTVEQTKWKGNLNFGFHAYRIRAVDAASRPGAWSDPIPLVVLAPDPSPKVPSAGQTVSLYPEQELVLEWDGGEGTNLYTVELKRGDETIYDGTVSRTELHLGQIPAGSYSWRVKGLIVPDEAYPGLAGRKWYSKFSKISSFVLKRITLSKPVLIHPLGETWPPSDGKMQFQWQPVPGAAAYEIQVQEILTTDQVKSGVAPKEKSFRTEESSIAIQLGEHGRFNWKVRALAGVVSTPGGVKPKSKSGTGDDSWSESLAEFYLKKNDLSNSKSVNLFFATGYSVLDVELIDTSRNINGRVTPVGFPIHAGASRLWSSMWGATGSVETFFYGIDGKTRTNFRFDLAGHYRYDLSIGWYVTVGLGAQLRQLPVLSPNLGGVTSNVSTLSLWGATARGELTKYLDARWGISFEMKIFLPMLSGKTFGTLTQHTPYHNVTFGGAAQFLADNHFAYSVGVNWDHNTTKLASVAGRDADKTITMDAFSLMVGVVYRFGSD